MNGVWHNPDFFRSRAVECMKMAMETGDTSFFLSMTQPVVGGSSSTEGGQKRRASTSSMMDSNTDDSAVGGHPHKRMSHRESDFSLGDDSVDLDVSFDNARHMEDVDFLLSQVATAPPQVASSSQLSRSFTGMPSVQAAAAASLLNEQERRSFTAGNDTSSSAFRMYNPVSKSGALGNNGRQPGNNGRRTGVSASWTVGSTFSQNDSNFSAHLFNTLIQEEGQSQEPPLGSNNDNVEMMQEFAANGPQHQQQQKQEECPQQKEEMTAEDRELASFFEKFAESLQEE